MALCEDETKTPGVRSLAPTAGRCARLSARACRSSRLWEHQPSPGEQQVHGLLQGHLPPRASARTCDRIIRAGCAGRRQAPARAAPSTTLTVRRLAFPRTPHYPVKPSRAPREPAPLSTEPAARVPDSLCTHTEVAEGRLRLELLWDTQVGHVVSSHVTGGRDSVSNLFLIL